MATPALNISRLILPVRPRILGAHDENIPAKLALASRIADLPGILVVDHDPAGGSRVVDVILQQPVASPRRQRRPILLCRIGSDAIVVFGLNDGDRHQVLSRRWGRLRQNGIQLFLPRDDEEIETAWKILRRAYDELVDISASAHPGRASRLAGMPRVSRTNLQ